MDRLIEKPILKDLSKKMVFLGGPRQVGKTTLARMILEKFPYQQFQKGLYLNWDFDEDRSHILKKQWDESHQLIVFDELHKYSRWKNWIKGLFDKTSHLHQFLVTGSARLDLYKRHGDSLLGRYHYWRLHPITLDELPPKMTQREGFERLMTVGGFPEVFLDGNEQEARRWRRERLNQIIKDDIRDLQSIKLVQDLDLFVEALRRRVGHLVVFSNIANDIQVSPKTTKHWLTLLDQIYLSFSIWPYTKNLSRALQKPPKVYFFDNLDVICEKDEGPRFENLVATHLLKKIHYLEDSKGLQLDLRYIRDKESREIDFVLIKNRKIFALIEVKLSDPTLSKSLKYYAHKLKPKYAIQIVGYLKQEYKVGECRVLSLNTALQTLFSNIEK